MAPRKLASDRELIAAYKKTGSVHKAGAVVGITGGSAHERLVRLGVVLKFPKWSEGDNEILRREYLEYRNRGKLNELAKRLGRTKPFICRKAGLLGLTSASHEKPYACVWKRMPEAEARVHFEKFRKSRLGLTAYCAKNGFDDLGFSTTLRGHFPDEWEYVIELKAPRQAKYRLGRHVEYSVRDDIKKLGYIAFRSPRSLGAVDVVGIKKGCVLFIQCKRSMALGVGEWNQLFDLSESVGAIPILAGRPTGKGLVYRKMLARKLTDGSKKKQPMEPFNP